MDSNRRTKLTLQVGEHYRYHAQDFVVVAIEGQRIQLRSLTQRKNICFQNYETLAVSYRHGNFYKTQDAPFLGQAVNIIEGLTEKLHARLNRQMAYVSGCIKKLRGRLPRKQTEELIGNIAEQIGDARPPSYTSVYGWRKIFLDSGENPLSLLPTRVFKRTYRAFRQPEVIQELIDYHIDLLYRNETPASIKAVVEAIIYSIEELNSKRPLSDLLKIPSTATLRRIINELDTYEVEKAQLGKNSAIKHQRWSKQFKLFRTILLRIECDTHVLDLIIVDKHGNILGRPYLTIALDVCSRRVIGWDISLNPPSVEKTIRAIKMSLSSNYERNGLGLHYILDNGSEFITKKLRACLGLFGAKVTFCEPYEPNQKPFVERWFKTLMTSLIHHMKGTTFSDIQKRGDYDSEHEAIFTIDQVQAIFKDWLDSVYHSDFHNGLGTSPDIYWDSHIDPVFMPRQFSDIDLHRLFLSKKFAKPANGRIGFLNLQWTGPEVAYLSTLNKKSTELKGTHEVVINQKTSRLKNDQLVVYYDPSDLGSAWVCHPDAPDDVFRVEAVNPEYQMGLTMDMHRLVQASIKQQAKTFNYSEARNNRIRINMMLATAKGKRARKLRERLLENGSLPRDEFVNIKPTKDHEANTFVIDPSKHLAHSNTPAVAQVIEVRQNGQ